MADDINKMNRTWLCSVVFTDIVNYSSQSVEVQIKWKARFNTYLASAIKDVPEDERIILDTGDGAAICFLGSPEVAMFASLELWHSLLLDEREQQPPFLARIGINLGPVKLVRDINGAPNAIGDGMNAGQRVMSFAGENQILVSQSYFEVVSRLSDDYRTLFTLKGVQTDKHIREHTVYKLSPPGAEPSPVSSTPQRAASVPAAALHQHSASTERVAQAAPQSRPENTAQRIGSIALVGGAVALVIVAAAATWYFFGSAVREKPRAQQGQISTTNPAVASNATPPAVVPGASAPSAVSPPTPSAQTSSPGGATSASKSASPYNPESSHHSLSQDKSSRVSQAQVATGSSAPRANQAVAPTQKRSPEIKSASPLATTPSIPGSIANGQTNSPQRDQPNPGPQQFAPAAPAAPAPRATLTSGVLHATVDVEHGTAVFENLPNARLHFTFDRGAWSATIRRQPNGMQTLVMHSLKPGNHAECDVRWEIIQ